MKFTRGLPLMWRQACGRRAILRCYIVEFNRNPRPTLEHLVLWYLLLVEAFGDD